MLFTTHSIVGAAIGSQISNPAISILCGVLSHHILDSIIHLDQGSYHIKEKGPNYLQKKHTVIEVLFTKRDWLMLFVDLITAGVLFSALLLAKPVSAYQNIFIGAFGGLLPDIIDSSPLWSSRLRKRFSFIKKYHHFHDFFHWPALPNQKIWGLGTQLLAIVISLFMMFR